MTGRPQTAHGVPAEGRAASAPYNFVRLPQQPMYATEFVPPGAAPWRSHDAYLPDLHNGHIDVDIRTLTPLFIGPPLLLDPETGGWEPPTHRDEVGTAQRSFRLRHDGPAVLPGSSISGALAAIVRVVSFARPGELYDPELFHRWPVKGSGSAALSRYQRYMKQLTRKPGGRLPETAGFLRMVQRRGDPEPSWWIQPLEGSGKPLKVRHEAIKDLFGPGGWREPGNDIKYRPSHNAKWFQREISYVMCRVKILSGKRGRSEEIVVPVDEASGQLEAIQRTLKSGGGAAERLLRRARPRLPPGPYGVEVRSSGRGMLVLTGNTGVARRRAYVFPLPKAVNAAVLSAQELRERGWLPVPPDVFATVDSDEQITQWQRETFKQDLPEGGGRAQDGRLRDGEPVWYVADGSEVSYFGRSGGFRIPYPYRRSDLLDESLRRDKVTSDTLDLAQAMFGDVVNGVAVRGRVRVGHAVLTGPEKELPPVRVQLLSPHRESFALYLNQPRPNDPAQLMSYDSTESEPRGFKFYLHRWDDDTDAADATGIPRTGKLEEAAQVDLVPLSEGLVFRARISFVNLAAAELGALLRAIMLANPTGVEPADPVCAHKLGYGRPLGFGSVHMTPTLKLINPAERYMGPGEKSPADADIGPFLAAFDALVVPHATETCEELTEGGGWLKVARLRELAYATAWQHRLTRKQTRPMEIEHKDDDTGKVVNEFAHDPVLPGVLHLPWSEPVLGQ